MAMTHCDGDGQMRKFKDLVIGSSAVGDMPCGQSRKVGEANSTWAAHAKAYVHQFGSNPWIPIKRTFQIGH